MKNLLLLIAQYQKLETLHYCMFQKCTPIGNILGYMWEKKGATHQRALYVYCVGELQA